MKMMKDILHDNCKHLNGFTVFKCKNLCHFRGFRVLKIDSVQMFTAEKFMQIWCIKCPDKLDLMHTQIKLMDDSYFILNTKVKSLKFSETASSFAVKMKLFTFVCTFFAKSWWELQWTHPAFNHSELKGRFSEYPITFYKIPSYRKF